MSKSATTFKGIFCPSITITDDDGSIDYRLWARHLDHLIDAGINGVLLFGSIGEFYAFDLETKKQAVRFAVDHIHGRIKVFAGIGDTDINRVKDFASSAQEAGVDALVVISPYYFGPSDPAAKRYFTSIAAISNLPIILYNFPARTGSDLSPQLVADLAEACPNIVGIKDTVDTISHTRKMVAATRKINPGFTVFSGYDEYYMPNRICGGNGVLCGLTNVEPETFAAMHRAYESGDFATALKKAERINRLMAVYDTADLFISAIKGAVKLKGLPISTAIQEPAVQLSEKQLGVIAAILGDDNGHQPATTSNLNN